MRHPFNIKMLHKALENMNSNTSFQEKRAVICMTLLFITGCRINELRNFNYKMIMDLYKYGTVYILGYKTKTTRRVDISDYQKLEFEKVLPLIRDFYDKVPKKSHVLSKTNGKDMSNKGAIKWMNKHLNNFNSDGELNIKSHSFRINYVTSIMKKYPVNIAQTIIGHKRVDTTMRYDRNILTSDAVKEILNNTKTI